MNPLLSVVIPAYNEENRLGVTLRKVAEYLCRRGQEFEIIVVDDRSSDQTVEVARQVGADFSGSIRILGNTENRGKGYSVRRGMLEARGTYALMSDADLSTPIEEIEKLEAEVVAGTADIAFGSRDIPGSVVAVHQSWFREHSGKLFNRMVRILTGLPYRDTQCGFKFFKMASCRPLFQVQRIENFSFDVELLYVARLWGLTARETPVVWRHSPGSKVRFLPDAPRMFVDLLRIIRNGRTGKYRKPAS